MWTDRRLLDLLDIQHPILQAPMVNVTTPELTAAVSEAGGLGSFGAAASAPERLREAVGSIRSRTRRPFAVNIFDVATEDFDRAARPGPRQASMLESMHQELGLGTVPEPRGLFGPAREQLDVLIEEQVPVVTFHFGAEEGEVARARAAGLVVLCSATTVEEALRLEQSGVHAVIAQGGEAGGHRGSFAAGHGDGGIGTLALVPQVVDSISVPVIAAGGIMDGRGLVAALALGAAGVQMGTAFLGCPEASVHAAWRDALASARAEDTTVTEAISGRAARGLRNHYIEQLEGLGEPFLPYPAQYSLSRDLRKAALERGDPRFLAMWAGQGVGLYRRRPAAELIADLVAEAQATLERLGRIGEDRGVNLAR